MQYLYNQQCCKNDLIIAVKPIINDSENWLTLNTIKKTKIVFNKKYAFLPLFSQFHYA